MKRLLIKYKPQLFYMLFGGITTAIDIALCMLCLHYFEMGTVLSNLIAWFVSVAFSFITNKLWVYGSRSMRARTLIKEFIAYYVGRGLSLIAGTIVMVIGVDLLRCNSFVTKLISDIVVTIMNYFFGFFVFKKVAQHVNDL